MSSFRIYSYASLLEPTLFNLYLHDIPKTKGLMFQYADDIAIVHQNRELKDGSSTLNDDLATLGNYFYKWRSYNNYVVLCYRI